MKTKKSFCTHYKESNSIEWVKSRMWCSAETIRETRKCAFFKRVGPVIREGSDSFFVMCAWARVWGGYNEHSEDESTSVECLCQEAHAQLKLEEI